MFGVRYVFTRPIGPGSLGVWLLGLEALNASTFVIARIMRPPRMTSNWSEQDRVFSAVFFTSACVAAAIAFFAWISHMLAQFRSDRGSRSIAYWATVLALAHLAADFLFVPS